MSPEINDARIHPTAIIEEGVELGPGSAVWDNVHVRGPGTHIGEQCSIGEKSYIAYGVRIGRRVKINAFVYICTAVTIEDGVMISAGTIFTNDRFPRATTPDLRELRTSAPDEHTLPTLVRRGATIGAGSVIGCGLTIGAFAMIGMGSVVTRSVPDFQLVVGQPARPIGWLCRCGEPVVKLGAEMKDKTNTIMHCGVCGRAYELHGDTFVERTASDVASAADHETP
jgi:acetyltransferase-like isoleucine patch superfamily enzyme